MSEKKTNDSNTQDFQPLERITVKTFDTSVNAHLFRIELENEGIESFIYDEETITMDPLLSNAIGGIKAKHIMTNFRSFKSTTVIISAITAFLFTIFPPMFKTVNKCLDCNHEFEALDM